MNKKPSFLVFFLTTACALVLSDSVDASFQPAKDFRSEVVEYHIGEVSSPDEETSSGDNIVGQFLRKMTAYRFEDELKLVSKLFNPEKPDDLDRAEETEEFGDTAPEQTEEIPDPEPEDQERWPDTEEVSEEPATDSEGENNDY